MKLYNLYDAAKAAGITTAVVTTAVGIILKKKDGAENMLRAQYLSGKRAEDILRKTGRFYEDPATAKMEKNLANAKSIKEFILSQLYCDDSSNVFITEDTLETLKLFSNHLGFEIVKLFEGSEIPLNKAGFQILKKNKKGELEFAKYFCMIKVLQKDGGIKINFTMR